jgi:hypothetical protein
MSAGRERFSNIFPNYARTKGAADFWSKGDLDFSALHELVAPYMVLPAQNAPQSPQGLFPIFEPAYLEIEPKFRR